MFISTADVFRTRQGVRDLLEVVHTHRSAVDRLGATGVDRTELLSIAKSGCVIVDPGSRTYSSILLAAAMPDEDFNQFVVATAILLADRLQSGAGEDDLYWNYDAFKDHFALADPPIRAALMNGFRLGHQLGFLNLPDMPLPESCLTWQKPDVLQMLKSDGDRLLAEMVENEAAAKTVGAGWTAAVNRPLNLSSKIAYRYLYERPLSLAPDRPSDVPLIPWT